MQRIRNERYDSRELGSREKQSGRIRCGSNVGLVTFLWESLQVAARDVLRER